MAGGYPDSLSRATQLVCDHANVDFIDLNLGCPLDLINDKGAGCRLAQCSNRLLECVYTMSNTAKDLPITAKVRYGFKEGQRDVHHALKKLSHSGFASLLTLHPRSKLVLFWNYYFKFREQRYSKVAEWDYVPECVKAIDNKCPFWVCGDVLSYEDYYKVNFILVTTFIINLRNLKTIQLME